MEEICLEWSRMILIVRFFLLELWERNMVGEREREREGERRGGTGPFFIPGFMKEEKYEYLTFFCKKVNCVSKRHQPWEVQKYVRTQRGSIFLLLASYESKFLKKNYTDFRKSGSRQLKSAQRDSETATNRTYQITKWESRNQLTECWSKWNTSVFIKERAASTFIPTVEAMLLRKMKGVNRSLFSPQNIFRSSKASFRVCHTPWSEPASRTEPEI